MYTLMDDSVITAFSKNAAPVLTVENGATVRIRTKDCYANTLRAENDPRGEYTGPKGGGNPSTGPIFIEGAKKGDTLKVEILSIEMDEYATMRIRPNVGFMGDRVSDLTVRAIRLENNTANLAGVTIPLDPMIGVIGVAPEGDDVDTETPGAHGGNMDNRLIRTGSTLYFPVQADGALFALGDVHAQMGDGEVCVCGLECPAWVTVKFTVIPGRQEKWPVLEDHGSFFTIASAQTLDEATKLAADAMLDFLKARTDISNDELILLLSLICDLEVCQMVDPLLTARMRLRPDTIRVSF